MMKKACMYRALHLSGFGCIVIFIIFSGVLYKSWNHFSEPSLLPSRVLPRTAIQGGKGGTASTHFQTGSFFESGFALLAQDGRKCRDWVSCRADQNAVPRINYTAYLRATGENLSWSGTLCGLHRPVTT